MRIKIVYLGGIIFCLVFLVGCGTSSVQKNNLVQKNDMEEFFKEYCDIYVNKYQSRDLKSYDIEKSDNMGYGYYDTIDECIQEMMKTDKLSEDSCQQYRKSMDLDCNEVRKKRQETYKKAMTYDGCIANGKSSRCFMFDTSQSQWVGASADQISNANVKYTECLQKVEFACAKVPKTW